MSRVLAWIMLGLCVAAFPAQAATPSRKITENEAEKLVQAYLGPPSPALMMMEDDEGDPERFFVILANNADTRYEHSFFVDRLTGDLWEVNACQEASNKGLRAAQARLWPELGITPADYDRLKRHGLDCPH